MDSTAVTVGAYRFRTCLGAGTLSGIWQCEDVRTSQRVACKVVELANLFENKLIPSLKREITIHRRMDHPNVVKLLDVHLDKKNIYLILEFCEGGNLLDKVRELNGLSESQAKIYFRQIMSALSYIHGDGIVHRDINLENILITRDNCIKITDFELSKAEQDFLQTSCGTLVYAAPEVVKGNEFYDFHADIWSAGIVLFAMVANHFPWDVDEDLPLEAAIAETVRQIEKAEFSIPDEFSPELADLIRCILHPEPRDRPSADDILCHPWLEHKPEEDEEFDHPDDMLTEEIKCLIEELERMEVEYNKDK